MQSRKQVLQICHDYKGPFRTIARQYAGSFSDCDVRTIFLRGPHSASLADAIYGEVEFLTLGPGSLRGLKLGALSMLRDLIGDMRPDLVIAHRYKPFYLATLLNRRMNFGLLLGVMHEYGFLRRPTRSLYSHLWSDNTQLVGVSRPVCDELLKQHQHLEGKVHCIPHAIEAEPLLDSVSARHELGIPLGKYCFGVIGRLVAKKNHRQLLDAFQRRDDDAVLALVGDGPLESELKSHVARLGLEDRVIFCGHHNDAKRLMKAFDSLVLPSTAEEAFGLVLLEAMAASTPVLSSDAPGPASVVGDAGVLFKVGNIDSLVEAMDRMRALSREETEALTQRALLKLGRDYSIGTFVSNLRSVPAVAEIVPVTM